MTESNTHLLCEVFLALSRQSWCLSRPESSTYLYFRVIYKNRNCFLICLSFPFSYDLLEDRNSVLLIFLFPVPIAVSEGTQGTWWGQSQVKRRGRKVKEKSKREGQRHIPGCSAADRNPASSFWSSTSMTMCFAPDILYLKPQTEGIN